MASTSSASTWSPAHYQAGTERHAGSVVGLAATLLPTLLLATLCLFWRVSQTWKDNARSLQWMFVGDFGMALIAVVYLALTLHATCRGNMGTSDELLSSSSRDGERTWFFALNLLSIVLLSASRAFAWVFALLYVANTQFRMLSRIAHGFFWICIAWGIAAIAVLPSTCGSGGSARFDFFSRECNHSVCPNCIAHLVGSLLDVGYLFWGIFFCYKFLYSGDGHFRQLSAAARKAHKESQSAQYLQWQKRRSTAIQVFIPHLLRLVAIVPMAFQFYAFDTSPGEDTSSNQSHFAAWQCVQVSWLCICTLLQPAMTAIYNLRSELVTAETLQSTSLSNRALGYADRHGTTRTQIQSTRKGDGVSQPRDSLDTESSQRDLTSGIVQERTFHIDSHYAGDSGIELQEIEHQGWNGKR